MKNIRRQSRKEEVSFEDFKKYNKSRVFADETIPMNLPENEAKKEASKSAQEKKVKALENKLDRTIEKTQKVINSAEYDLNNSIMLSKYSQNVVLGANTSYCENPSHMQFLGLVGNPKRLLNYIIINLKKDGYFEAQTDDLLAALKIKNPALKSTLGRLKSRGFIKIYSQPSSSVRRITVNPSILEI